ncbi:hypothetical protein D3C85_648260 [compost metagenome]
MSSKFWSTQHFVVVAVDQVDIALQPSKNFLRVLHASKREVTQVVNTITTLYTAVPVFNQQFIMFFQRALWPRIWTERLDARMCPVRIRYEPNVTHPICILGSN